MFTGKVNEEKQPIGIDQASNADFRVTNINKSKIRMLYNQPVKQLEQIYTR